MTKSAQSVFYFGIYLLLTGLNLLAAPNMLLGMFGLAPTEEVWIRVVGIIVIYIGVYYAYAGRKGLAPFFQVTVYTRASLIFLLAMLVVTGLAEPPLVLFGVIDLAGAAWTQMALRKEKLQAAKA